MEIKELLQKINALAAKKKTAGLTPAELAEQALLRREYLDNIKVQLTNQLDCVTVVDCDQDIH